MESPNAVPQSAPITTVLVPPQPLPSAHVYSASAVPPRPQHTRIHVEDGTAIDVPSGNVPAAIQSAKDNGLEAHIDLSHIPGFQLVGKVVPAEVVAQNNPSPARPDGFARTHGPAPTPNTPQVQA